MGREATFLLGLLGLLAGAFVGLLSLKLFVPRPPVGAGPDIQLDLVTVPPEFFGGGFPPDAFAAAPPLVALTADPEPLASAVVEPPRPTSSRFAAARGFDVGAAADVTASPDEVATAPPEPAATRSDPFLTRAAWQVPVEERPEAAAETGPATLLPAAPPVAQPVAQPPVGAAFNPVVAPPASSFAPPPAYQLAPPPASPVAPPPAYPVADPGVTPAAALAAGRYIAQPGDSWWSVAERAYGDGRLYRALFAWNRAIDPRVSLAPGTPLDVPPVDRLLTAWPRLVPR